MRLANYRQDGTVKVGAIVGNRILDLASASGELAGIGSVEELISKGLLTQAKEVAMGKSVTGRDLSSVKLSSPVLNPEKVLLVAVNYFPHGHEEGVVPPSEPYFFTKFRSCIVGPDEPIILPHISSKVDWEAELAVVIGKKGKYIKRDDAFDHVAGYTVANDITFRDLQLPEGWPKKVTPLGPNWLKGKALDEAFPFRDHGS